VVGLRPEPIMTLPRTAADVLSDHVVFEVESIDRMYLNVYVPKLQRVGQVVGFLTRHRGFEIASTALVAPMSKDFVEGIGRYAADHGLPLIDFVKGARKDDVMHDYLARSDGSEGVFVHRAGTGEGPDLPYRKAAQPHHGSGLPVDRDGHRDG
jgi:hypothetical protein